MLLTLSRFELKNLLRNKMTVVMVVYPLIMGLLGKYLLEQNILSGPAVGITAMLIAIIGGFTYGAMAGFSLLDDRDDQVFASIEISPVPLSYYIWFKVAFAWLLATLSSFFIIWYIGVIPLTGIQILLVSALSALQTPTTAFLVNAFANNKVEGFVTMKASGFLLMLPIAAFFFLDAKEWLFAIAPGHWAAKAVQYALLRQQIEAGFVHMNLHFNSYVWIGFLYNLILIGLTFKLFIRKNNI